MLLLGVYPTIAQQNVEPLIRKLETTQGTEKVDLLNQIAKEIRDSDRLASMRYAREANVFSKSLNYVNGQALAFKNEGIIWFFIGNNDSASICYQKAYELYSKTNDLSGQSACLNNLGLIKQETGNYDEAITYYQKSIAIDKRLGEEVSAATSMMNIGEVFIAQGKSKQAIALMEKAYTVFYKHNDVSGLLNVLNNRSAAYDNLQKFDKAISDITEYIKLSNELGNRYYEARGHSNKALYLLHMGKIEQAKESINASLAISDESDDGYGVYNTYIILADIFSLENKYDESIFYLHKVLKQAEEMDNKKMIAKVLTSIGRNLMEMNQLDKARGYFEESLQIAQTIGAEFETLPNLYNLSIIEAIVRNFKTADSMNELYTQKSVELFGNQNYEPSEIESYTNANENREATNSIVHWIIALCLLLSVFLLSIIAFRK